MKNMDSGNNILSFLEKKLMLFKQYQAITERMKETIIENKKDNLVGFVKRRQDCINKINKIDQLIEDAFKVYGEHFKYVCGRFSGLIDSYMQHIKHVMEAVAPLEQEVMTMVKVESESVKTDLLRRRHVHHAVKGYSNGFGSRARFLDTRK